MTMALSLDIMAWHCDIKSVHPPYSNCWMMVSCFKEVSMFKLALFPLFSPSQRFEVLRILGEVSSLHLRGFVWSDIIHVHLEGLSICLRGFV